MFFNDRFTFQYGVGDMIGPPTLLSTPSFSLLVRDFLRARRCFLASGVLIFIRFFCTVECVVRAFARLRLWLRRFRTRFPLSVAIDSRRFVEITDAVSPLLESLRERGRFLVQNSVKASWLLFDKRRANGMVSVFCRKMELCNKIYSAR